MGRPVVGVLLGGTSAEREVSLASGQAVATALEQGGYGVRSYDYGAAEEMARGSVINRLCHALREGSLADVEVAFPVLHGGAGEDGRVQGVLELAGLPYTGTGVIGSAMSMDKWVAKGVMAAAGIPVPEGILWAEPEPPPPAVIDQWGDALGWPLVVKPVDQGSTVGLTVVHASAGVADAIQKAASWSRRVLIERFIPGREITVAVLQGRALPVIEIIPRHGIYDYDCKYTPGLSEYVCPARLEEEPARQIAGWALQAFEVLAHRDYSRMDFRLTEEGRAYLLEGNTAPGFTATSLVPKAAQAAGIDFVELCRRLVESARGRNGAPV